MVPRIREVDVARRLERLTLDTLADLPAEVRRDLTWECEPVVGAQTDPAEAEERKRDWLSGVLLEWGSCGRVAYHDDEPAGFILYAPPAYLPGTRSFPTAPISEDAVQLATAVVLEGHQAGGLGRALVQVMARDLVRRGGIRAVEAIATTGPDGPGSICGPVPAEFLQRVGFTTLRAHPRNPRLRLDLRSLVSWLDEVGTAWERLRGAVRPLGRPVPASRHAGLPDGRP
jgi:GNAT superfamily N-acetyltransferase